MAYKHKRFHSYSKLDKLSSWLCLMAWAMVLGLIVLTIGGM